ncbi:MAG: MarR family winged helix-turn-helix transcriptional regulator [Armatimonadota bacterium]
MSEPREATIERIADLFSDVMRGVFSWRTHSFPSDVTLGELRCMMVVGRLGAPSMTDLSERLHLKPSTVTAFVDDLVQHGFAERQVDAEDRRMVRVALTAKGKRLRRQKRKARRERLMAALADLNDDQLGRVLDVLEMLHDATRRAARKPQGEGQ